MIKIIPFTPKHSLKVKELLLSVLEGEFNHTGVQRPDLDDIPKYYQKDEFSNFFLALEDDKLVGTIAISSQPDGTGIMKRFCVSKNQRKNGIGQQLLTHLLDYAKSKKYIAIYLQTTTDMKTANQLYEKNGFEKIKQPKQLLNAHLVPTSIFYKLKLGLYAGDEEFDEFDDKHTMHKRMVL